MASARRRKPSRKKKRHPSHHIAIIFFLIIAAVFLYFEEFGEEETGIKIPEITTQEEEPVVVIPDVPVEPVAPVAPEKTDLPRVAIVMDDLGVNRNKAKAVFALKEPITLSILPQRRFSNWIADEGHKLGHDIMLHMPMEATKPLKLGAGGLYLKMSRREMLKVLDKNIQTIPHIMGASNHMGSAFTEDARSIKVVLKELKKRKLFFLDSFTSSKSVGLKVARDLGVPALRRDVFLDDSSDPDEIRGQWKRLIKIARKKGSAVALAHPKKNTLEFLEKALKENRDVQVVPLSELIRGG